MDSESRDQGRAWGGWGNLESHWVADLSPSCYEHGRVFFVTGVRFTYSNTPVIEREISKVTTINCCWGRWKLTNLGVDNSER